MEALQLVTSNWTNEGSFHELVRSIRRDDIASLFRVPSFISRLASPHPHCTSIPHKSIRARQQSHLSMFTHLQQWPLSKVVLITYKVTIDKQRTSYQYELMRSPRGGGVERGWGGGIKQKEANLYNVSIFRFCAFLICIVWAISHSPLDPWIFNQCLYRCYAACMYISMPGLFDIQIHGRSNGFISI